MSFVDRYEQQLRRASASLPQPASNPHRQRMFWRRLRRGPALGLVVLAATSASAVAVASGVGGLWPESARVTRDAVVAPPAGPGNLGAAHQTSVSALRSHLGGSGSGTDWDSARSFAIPGTRLRGWTFDQPGKRCLALPDPIAEGYGVKCASSTEVAAGEASVIFRPPTDSKAPNIVGVLISGGRTAAIETRSGARAPFERTGDVYVGIAPAGSRLVSAGRTQSIGPPSGRFVAPVEDRSP